MQPLKDADPELGYGLYVHTQLGLYFFVQTKPVVTELNLNSFLLLTSEPDKRGHVNRIFHLDNLNKASF